LTQEVNLSIPASIAVSLSISLDQAMLSWLSALTNGIDAKLEKIMASLDDIVADVAAENTAIASVSTLIQGLRDQIANLGINPADQAKIDAIFAGVEANKAALATALDTNVPVAAQSASAAGNPT
jgi:hypothetical protein